MRRRILTAMIGAALVPAPAVLAHPPEPPEPAVVAEVARQVTEARESIAAAVAARDIGHLRLVYAPSFVHTHGSGKMDGRDTRIVSLLAGDPVIELAPVQELAIRVPHPEAAVVTGRSPILNRAENRDYDFRWVQLWVRVHGQWQLAASQATRLPP